MLYISGKVKKLDLISIILIVSFIVISISLIKNYYEGEVAQYRFETVQYKDAFVRLKKQVAMPRYPFATNYDRKDYHDYEFIEAESLREGPGEQGSRVELTSQEDRAKNRENFQKFGYFTATSDAISVNRSLPDVRLPR
jgi:hypothetical protein